MTSCSLWKICQEDFQHLLKITCQGWSIYSGTYTEQNTSRKHFDQLWNFILIIIHLTSACTSTVIGLVARTHAHTHDVLFLALLCLYLVQTYFRTHARKRLLRLVLARRNFTPSGRGLPMPYFWDHLCWRLVCFQKWIWPPTRTQLPKNPWQDDLVLPENKACFT